jgi:hypothetical protein
MENILIVLEWLAKVTERTKKCIELHGEYAE